MKQLYAIGEWLQDHVVGAAISVFVGIVVTAFWRQLGSLLRRGWCWFKITRLPHERLVVGVATFGTEQSPAGKDAATFWQRRVLGELAKREEEGNAVRPVELTAPVPGQGTAPTHDDARAFVLRNRVPVHAIIWGRLQSLDENSELDAFLTVVRSPKGLRLDDLSLGPYRNLEGEKRLQFVESRAQESMKVVAGACGVAAFGGERWGDCIRFLSEADTPESLFYSGTATLIRAFETLEADGLVAATERFRMARNGHREQPGWPWLQMARNEAIAIALAADSMPWNDNRKLSLLNEAISAFNRSFTLWGADWNPVLWASDQGNKAVVLLRIEEGSKSQEKPAEARQQRLLCIGEASRTLTLALGANETTDNFKQSAWLLGIQANVSHAYAELLVDSQINEAVSLFFAAARYNADAASRYYESVGLLGRLKHRRDWSPFETNRQAALIQGAARLESSLAEPILARAVRALKLLRLVALGNRSSKYWCSPQENLGDAYLRLAMHSEGREARKCIEQSIWSYGLCLRYCEDHPEIKEAVENGLERARRLKADFSPSSSEHSLR